MGYIGFGLAPVKREGHSTSFVTGEVTEGKAEASDSSKWIELRYDPDDPQPSGCQLESCTQMIDSIIIKDGLSKDQIVTLITAIANNYDLDCSGI